MKGKFEDELGRKNSGTVVDAEGWLEWSEIPLNIQRVRVDATIAQANDDPALERSGRASTGLYQRPKEGAGTRVEWRCDVPEAQGEEFHEGPSLGSAVLVDPTSSWAWPWTDDPVIT